MAKRKRASARPTDAETLIANIFRRVGLEREARDWRAIAAWREVAGPRLVRHTRAERVRGTQLIVRAASSAWANELGFMRAQLLESLHATPGCEWIEDLRYTIGPLDEVPSWDDEDEPPRSPPPPEPAPRPDVHDGLVTAELLRIEDPELRGRLAELYARARARR